MSKRNEFKPCVLEQCTEHMVLNSISGKQRGWFSLVNELAKAVVSKWWLFGDMWCYNYISWVRTRKKVSILCGAKGPPFYFSGIVYNHEFINWVIFYCSERLRKNKCAFYPFLETPQDPLHFRKITMNNQQIGINVPSPLLICENEWIRNHI